MKLLLALGLAAASSAPAVCAGSAPLHFGSAGKPAPRHAPPAHSPRVGDSARPEGRLPPGLLAFHQRAGSKLEVFASSDGGATARVLTNDSADDSSPSLSPDGTAVAFLSTRAGRSHLFVVPFAGGPAVQLTTGPVADESPAWAPDGTAVFFHSHRGGRWHICSVPSKGGAVSVLDTGDVECLAPAVAPDGRRLACQMRRRGTERWKVGMVDLGGHVLWEFGVSGSDFNETPSISPDGRSIYFAASSPDGYQLWQIDSAGRGPAEQLSSWPGWKLHPVPVARGRMLLMDEKTPAGWRLGTLDLATGTHAMLPSEAERFSPSWRDRAGE